MENTGNSTKKFRPYFSPSELAEIISWGKRCGGSINLLKYLETFELKISLGHISSQLELAPTLESALELTNTHNLVETMEAKKVTAYNKWKNSPVRCTSQELALSQMYRYENNLMNPEDELLYEKQMGFHD
jgi:hypothetical protein